MLLFFGYFEKKAKKIGQKWKNWLPEVFWSWYFLANIRNFLFIFFQILKNWSFFQFFENFWKFFPEIFHFFRSKWNIFDIGKFPVFGKLVNFLILFFVRFQKFGIFSKIFSEFFKIFNFEKSHLFFAYQIEVRNFFSKIEKRRKKREKNGAMKHTNTCPKPAKMAKKSELSWWSSQVEFCVCKKYWV